MPTPKSFAELAALWVTGYTPSQTDFQNLFSSFENVVDDNLLIGQEESITAVYPSSQGTATPLTKKINVITNNGAGLSACKLPPALKGAICFVIQTAAADMDLYPSSGDAISTNATNAAVTIKSTALYMCVCVTDGNWFIISNEKDFPTTREYIALISQSGTNAPTATVIKNTLGFVPVYTYTSVGAYVISAPGYFTVDKTTIFINTIDAQINVALSVETVGDAFDIETNLIGSGDTDSLLNNNSLHITVYP